MTVCSVTDRGLRGGRLWLGGEGEGEMTGVSVFIALSRVGGLGGTENEGGSIVKLIDGDGNYESIASCDASSPPHTV